MNSSIIGSSYDIRGIYPTELDEDMAYRFGNTLVRVFGFQKTAVGYDARLSGPSLRDALIRGITDAGASVVDIGLCSTDMCGFTTVRYSDIDFSIMITASHNPKEYNGFKITKNHAEPVNIKSFGAEIREKLVGEMLMAQEKWVLESRAIVADWVTHILSFIDTSLLRDLKVVVDAGNGTAGVFMTELAARARFTMIPLFLEPDGNFPNHHPSPIEPKNTLDMRNKVVEIGADLGVAYDGDADRMYVCDENGIMFSGTVTTAMIASIFLKRHKGEKVIYNAVCGDIVPETILAEGGTPVVEKVGHVYIKEAMSKDPIICFWGEHSGHYYFRDNNNADSGAIAFMTVFAAICSSWKKTSELRKAFEKYPQIPETNFRVDDTKAMTARLKEAYSDGKQKEFDGLTVRYPDWWFNVRPSSNEPLLRLNLEAKNESILEEKFQELQAFFA